MACNDCFALADLQDKHRPNWNGHFLKGQIWPLGLYVFTITHAAKMLGEDEDWLHKIPTAMGEPDTSPARAPLPSP
jgi:hypothetical protein